MTTTDRKPVPPQTMHKSPAAGLGSMAGMVAGIFIVRWLGLDPTPALAVVLGNLPMAGLGVDGWLAAAIVLLSGAAGAAALTYLKRNYLRGDLES